MLHSLTTRFGTGVIVNHSRNSTSGIFVSDTASTTISGGNIESNLLTAYMWRYMQLHQSIKDARARASELVADDNVVKKIFDPIDVCIIGKSVPSVPEPEELRRFLTQMVKLSNDNDLLRKEYTKLSYQLEICCIDLEKTRNERQAAISVATVKATDNIYTKLVEAEASAASLHVALELAKGLCLDLHDGVHVNLGSPSEFGIRIMLKASMVQVAEQKDKIKELEAELQNRKEALAVALNFKACRYGR